MCEFKPITKGGLRNCYNCQSYGKARCNNQTDIVHPPGKRFSVYCGCDEIVDITALVPNPHSQKQ